MRELPNNQMDSRPLCERVLYNVPFVRRPILQAVWHGRLIDKACSDLTSCTFASVDSDENQILGQIVCRERPLNDAELAKNGRSFADRMYACLEFETVGYDIEAWERVFRQHNPAISDIEVMNWRSMGPAFWLSSFCDRLLFVVGLAYAFPLSTDIGYCQVGDSVPGNGIDGFAGIDQSADAYPYLSGGIVSPLTLDQTLRWSRKCAGIWDGQALSNVEKAVSCLSHAVAGTKLDDVERLLWTTAGLESLVCDGKESKLTQLRLRLPLLADTMNFADTDNFIKRAYDFRSRLFHGDLPVQNRFNPDDSTYSVNRYDARIEHFGLGLMVLLIASIWKCIQKDANGLEWLASMSGDPIFVNLDR